MSTMPKDLNDGDSSYAPGILDDKSACAAWRSNQRLFTSLLAIFSAAGGQLVGQRVGVRLRDETRVAGRLVEVNGRLNLTLDQGVLVERPYGDREIHILKVSHLYPFFCPPISDCSKK
ncbi:unnamed protein product [Protopolystoma xenopodis]|uniref:LSM domain-containing protein n=1 Tax=Protopolystoma xenopodis TaxID=117903 RepID=A0A448WV50_9PLAT|nr:unnamed protein product [Protopolystoma xenopodis]